MGGEPKRWLAGWLINSSNCAALAAMHAGFVTSCRPLGHVICLVTRRHQQRANMVLQSMPFQWRRPRSRRLPHSISMTSTQP